MNRNTEILMPNNAVAHLSPEVWQKVNLNHLRKMISEFAHEMLLEPELVLAGEAWSTYILPVKDQNIVYRFNARLLALDQWYIDPLSLSKEVEGQATDLDAIAFLVEFKNTLGLSDAVMGTYLEEVISCLNGSAYMYANSTHTAEQLIHMDYQDIEHAMTAGHPCFVANSARIGFDASDYQNYAPEAAAPFQVIWLAGHKSRTEFTTIEPLTYQEVLEQELDRTQQDQFDALLAQKGLDPKDYYYFPVHPWQWFNKLTHVFAGDIATNLLLCLGYSNDQYLPQQSVRTLFNISDTSKYYVKSALSILNMGFMRGLSPYFMRTTPNINKWVYNIVQHDAYLQKKQFTMLRECATVGYTHTCFEATFQQDTPYKKMLATLWRESPLKVIEPGQKLMTMAALLHIDNNGSSMLVELIRSSGLDITTWLQRYLDCYLSPLLHCYYYHDMRFMPHGENLILVLEGGKPVKAIMKDIGEEVAIVDPDKELPETVQRIRIKVPEELRLLSIFTQIFDCFFRFLNQVLVEHAGYPEEQFWELAADCILEYQRSHPELREKFKKYDLFTTEIPKTCLNRLQINNSQKMIDAADPFRNQQFAGTLKNPLAITKKTLA